MHVIVNMHKTSGVVVKNSKGDAQYSREKD